MDDIRVPDRPPDSVVAPLDTENHDGLLLLATR